MHPENKEPLLLKNGQAQTRYSHPLFCFRLVWIDFCESSGLRPERPIIIAKLLASRVIYEIFNSKGNGK